jgi:hypothetical protein
MKNDFAFLIPILGIGAQSFSWSPTLAALAGVQTLVWHGPALFTYFLQVFGRVEGHKIFWMV